MNTKPTIFHDRFVHIAAGLVLATALFVSSLILLNGLAQAQAFDGAIDVDAPTQAGVPHTITMWTSPTGQIYANSLNGVYYYAEVVDEFGAWVPAGTPVSVSYDLRAWNWPGGFYSATKNTDAEGQIWGAWIHVESPGVVTFSAGAQVPATACITTEFISNPAAAITLPAAPTATEMGGGTTVVSATLAGLHDGFPSDGTEVFFSTSLGSIDPAGNTVAGLVTVTLTSGEIFGTATITATVNDVATSTPGEFLPRQVIYLPVVFRDSPGTP